ncbi:related to aminopeptidase [Ustilago trichophora]|uniref:Peptide hydrolase n=1 Tax=Ustilago trichophora TaxID=86804 RepID=A0A5C3EC47_9BASI|nr:related to aminopeptidase [Ustilago trichophora]
MFSQNVRTLLLAFALAATSAKTAPTAAAATEWTYWTTPSLPVNAASQLSECATEVARVQPNAGEEAYFVQRALSTSTCVQALDRAYAGAEEVVLFKPEAVVPASNLRGDEMSWMDRALQALMFSSFSDLPDLPDSDTAGEQISFRIVSETHPRVITATNNTVVLSLTPEALATIDSRATFDTRIQRLVFRPASFYSDEKPKPEPSFKKPKYNAVIAKLASSSALYPARITKDLRILTGEDPQPKDIGTWHSRHSSTYGARLAGKWIKQQLEQSLSPLNGSSCDFWEYSAYFAPNIVCHVPASPATKEDEGAVIVSAHYDSRGTFGSTTAPGGDDDGSGTAALLAIARALGSSAISPSSPIQLIAFSGEEQGLVGSQHYASHLSSTSLPVKLALQMDMLAYHKPGEPLQIAFPDKLSTKSATKHIWNIADIYAPELEQGYTPACCSDHQSFWENDFPATWVFERNGPIADPKYHNSGDTTDREGYDVEQLASIAKVVVASLLDVAGFQM